MAWIRRGHTDSSLSRNPRPRASTPQDSTSQAPEAPTIPSSEGGVPSNPSQRRYETRRLLTTPGATSSRLESSVHRTPTKRAKTSGPGELSRPSQPDPRAPVDSQRLSSMSPEAFIKRPMVTAPPIEGNLDCRAIPFHSELYFDLEVMRQQQELRDSFGLLQRYHLEHLMTHREFFYPRVALDFYQSMTTHGARSPTAIHFSIDGRQGILKARHVAEALHIPYQLVDLADFKKWSPISQRDMVHILSRGTSIDLILLRKELPLGMLLVDVLLRSNLFLLQHLVQRRGAILGPLFRILEGFSFGPYHLIIASLLHFEEKVHRKKLQRVDTIPLLFPRLLCHILEYMGYLTQPHLEHHHHCQERFTLEKWTQLAGYWAPLGAPPRPAPPVPS